MHDETRIRRLRALAVVRFFGEAGASVEDLAESAPYAEASYPYSLARADIQTMEALGWVKRLPTKKPAKRRAGVTAWGVR